MKSCYSIIIVAILLILGNSLSTKAQNMEHNNTFNQIFPKGNELPEQFSQYFIGQAYLASDYRVDFIFFHGISKYFFNKFCCI